MTSNIGARIITDKKSFGFVKGEEEKEYETIKKEVITELKKTFRPEFVNRVDEIIVFHKLEEEELTQIFDIMIKELTKRVKDQNIEIKVNEDAKQYIIKKGTDTTYGARPLRRAIQSILEDKIAEEILDGNIREGDKVQVSVKDDKIVIKSLKKIEK